MNEKSTDVPPKTVTYVMSTNMNLHIKLLCRSKYNLGSTDKNQKSTDVPPKTVTHIMSTNMNLHIKLLCSYF